MIITKRLFLRWLPACCAGLYPEIVPRRAAASLGLALLLWLGGGASTAGADEIELPDATRKQLDTFDDHRIRQADKAFNDQNWRLAIAEYDGFLLEFPDSPALPYALLRKGRAMHLEGRRFEAIKVYQELLDFFPDDVLYAAAALYYQGLCHKQNGELAKAMVPWAKLADDDAYAQHRLSASAINELADYFHAQGNVDQAAKYFAMVAVNFRRDNPDAAREAIAHAVRYHVRVKPDEPALRAFYRAVQTFQSRPRAVPDDLLNDRDYWDAVRAAIRQHGTFESGERELADRYYRYWAQQMAGRFEDWDAYQIDRIAFEREHERDTARWMQRLDEQFTRGHQPERQDRVVTWIELYVGHPEKIEHYYAQLDFAKAKPADVIRLVLIFARDAQDFSRARAVFEQVRWAEVSDADKHSLLLRHIQRREVEWLWFWQQTCARFENADLGRYRLLALVHWRYRHWRGEEYLAAGLPVADRLTQVTQYASQAWMWRGDLLHYAGDHEQAIASYRQSRDEPASLFAVAQCLHDLDRLEQAVAQLQEIENFFPDRASTAALRQAEYYKAAEQTARAIAAYRAVLRKYPKSGAAGHAHVELEHLGVQTGGGVDAN